MFTVNTKDLEKAIKKALVFTNQKSYLPILRGIHISFKNNICELSSTNLETFFKIRLSGEGDNFPGTIIEDPKLLLKSLSLFDTNAEIEFDETSIKLTFKSGKKSNKINSISKDEYPPFPNFTAEKSNTISNIDKINDAWKHIKTSTSTDDARPTLMMCKWINNQLVVTDGFRISLENVEIPFEILVAPEVMNVLTWFDDIVNVEIGKREDQSFVVFSNNEITLFNCTENNNGIFPPYDQILPKEYENETVINTKDLLDALKYMVANFSGEACKYNSETKSLSVSSESTGEFIYEINLGNVTFGFNPSYMKEIVEGQFKPYNNVTLGVNKNNTPIGLYNNEYNGLSVLMPMCLDK